MKVSSETVTKYFELANKDSWTAQEKDQLIRLFTLRGLNSLLAAHGASAFAQFEQKRGQTQPWYGRKLSMVQTQSDSPPSSELPSGAKSLLSIWSADQTSGERLFVARFTLLGERIHDFQLKEGKRSTHLTLASFLVGAGGLLLMVILLATFKRNGVLPCIVLGVLMGLGAKRIGKSGELKAVFVTHRYGAAAGAFASANTKLETPYPGPASGGVTEAIRFLVAEEIKQLIADSSNSADQETLAKSYRERAAEVVAKADVVSYRLAIGALSRSARACYEEATMLDVAYDYTSLARLGVDRDLNRVRAEAILAALSSGKNPAGSPRQLAVSIINLYHGGKTRDATALRPDLDRMLKNSAGRAARDERVLEALYLTEGNPAKRQELSEDLVRASPNNALYYHYQGVAAKQAGNTELAKASQERAAAISRPERVVQADPPDHLFQRIRVFSDVVVPAL